MSKEAELFLKEKGITDLDQWLVISENNKAFTLPELLTDFANSDNWIAVKDRLPEINEEVLVRGRFNMDYLQTSLQTYHIKDGQKMFNGFPLERVDFWMRIPLPSLPNS